MTDALIVGGGVIGLSLAYELAGEGWKVRVVDRGIPGREASWAGAGILPPAGAAAANDPYDRLLQLSNELHRAWSEGLREETGIDNGLRRCGGIYLARDAATAGELGRSVESWRRTGVALEELSAAELGRREPALAGGAASPGLRSAYLLPDEMQLRNPRHLKALLAGCALRGVEVSAGVAVEDFEIRGERIASVQTSGGPIGAEVACLTSGPWTRALLARLGVQAAMKPVRGQMALLNSDRPLLHSIVNEGPRYLVPRPDGRILVGSTEEQAGFEKRTTAEGIAGLLAFATGIAPGLKAAQFEQCWAGLRPGTLDGRPYLGPLPGLANAFVAAGHFRSGLQLSTGTALVMGRLMRGLDPEIDLSPFRVDRG
ncbi:MAG TPA: glycine oxidase ThiO [Pirellulales bacterium]|jgi:glycine oxidase|nr:glycine oxidase ThiO [Pirellulales bacterium]